jgi:hypothetical protein
MLKELSNIAPYFSSGKSSVTFQTDGILSPSCLDPGMGNSVLFEV